MVSPSQQTATSELGLSSSVAAGRHSDVSASNLALPWVMRLQYGMVFGGLAIVLGLSALYGLGVSVLLALAPLAVMLCGNIAVHFVPRLSARYPQRTIAALFVLDILCLTGVLGLTGGAMNPFTVLYLVQITLSAVVLQKAWTWFLGVISALCFGLLFFFNVPMPGLHVHEAEPGLSPHLIGMWIAFLVATMLIIFFTGKISDSLRKREQQILTLQAEIARSERLASLVTLAAGAAHELGTPLGTIAVISRELERYASTLADEEAALEDAKLIRSEVERCRKILERMSVDGAEPLGEAAQSIRVGDLVKEVIDQFAESQRPRITVAIASVDTTATLPVQATVQSLIALTRNALDASDASSLVSLSAAQLDREIVFSVDDQGRGMSESILRRIGEPFFTTKEPGSGMGLGVFLARTFAERIGGCLTFESRLGHGTRARLKLPMDALKKETPSAA